MPEKVGKDVDCAAVEEGEDAETGKWVQKLVSGQDGAGGLYALFAPVELVKNLDAMMAVRDGGFSVTLEDFYTNEEDANQDDHGLIVGLGNVLKGAVIVADGISTLGELDEGLPLHAGVADELADGADGDDGMTHDGVLVAGPAHHVGPEVVVY